MVVNLWLCEDLLDDNLFQRTEYFSIGILVDLRGITGFFSLIRTGVAEW